MYRSPAASSPSAFLRTEMLRASPPSSTKVSGQTSPSSSSFPTTCPPRLTRARRVPKAFGVSGTGSPSRSSRRSASSRRNGPNSYKCLVGVLITPVRILSELCQGDCHGFVKTSSGAPGDSASPRKGRRRGGGQGGAGGGQYKTND